MSVIGLNYPTLVEASKLFGVDGNPLPLAELLTQKNPSFDDIPWVEANGVTGHRISTRTGLPQSTWRKLNGGVLPTKGNYGDVIESMGELVQLGKVDKKLADYSTNAAHFRMVENAGHIEAMGQDWMQALFYGDSSINPEQFLGLSPRYYDIGAGAPENAENIIDAGGVSTDNTSIWIVNWGDSVHGVYPKGSSAGLKHEDYGVELALAPDGIGELPMYRDWFEITGGIAVKDWRDIVRIANISVGNLTKSGATGADLTDLVVQGLEQLNSDDGGAVIYANRTITSFFRRQLNNKTNVWLTPGEVGGRKITMFDGHPVRRVDRLVSTESRVV